MDPINYLFLQLINMYHIKLLVAEIGKMAYLYRIFMYLLNEITPQNYTMLKIKILVNRVHAQDCF